jgi:hypothetical protein
MANQKCTREGAEFRAFPGAFLAANADPTNRKAKLPFPSPPFLSSLLFKFSSHFPLFALGELASRENEAAPVTSYRKRSRGPLPLSQLRRGLV